MKVYEVNNIIQDAAKAALQEFAGADGDLGTFLYGLEPEFNMKFSGPMPQIFLEPIKRTWNSDNGQAEYPIVIHFLDQDKADSIGEQVKLIEARMESLQDKFISNLLLKEEFNNTVFTSTPAHRVLQAILTGWQLNFTLIDKLVIC